MILNSRVIFNRALYMYLQFKVQIIFFSTISNPKIKKARQGIRMDICRKNINLWHVGTFLYKYYCRHVHGLLFFRVLVRVLKQEFPLQPKYLCSFHDAPSAYFLKRLRDKMFLIIFWLKSSIFWLFHDCSPFLHLFPSLSFV